MDQDALIVIDMQRAFLDPEGSIARLGGDVEELRTAIPGCLELVRAARSASRPVIHVRTVLRPDYRDGGRVFNDVNPESRSAGLLVAGTEDAEFIPELRPEPEDFVVEKLRFSAFYATQLEALLASLGADELVLAGVTTNICVESSARDAAQRNFKTTVVADATAEVERARHLHALETLAAAFCEVAPCEEVMRRWSVIESPGAREAVSVDRTRKKRET
ncbi:MAG: cysteine hydrolase [Actinobacteria bacterium]|nr:cysteine hydrolase [Actinomycetota bacterium]